MNIKKILFSIRKWELDSRALSISVSGLSLFSQLSAAKELNLLQEKQEDKKKRQVLPEKIQKEVAYNALKHGILEARRWACKKNPGFIFVTGTDNNLKTKYRRILVNNKERKFSTIPHVVQLSMISDEIVPEVMTFAHNLHASGGAIS